MSKHRHSCCCKCGCNCNCCCQNYCCTPVQTNYCNPCNNTGYGNNFGSGNNWLIILLLLFGGFGGNCRGIGNCGGFGNFGGLFW